MAELRKIEQIDSHGRQVVSVPSHMSIRALISIEVQPGIEAILAEDQSS